MFYQVPEFVSTGIPALINGTNRLNVLFATYNTVNGYDGDVDTGKDGLSIKVQSGHLEYSPFVLPALMAPDPSMRSLGSITMREQGRQVQRELESSLKIETQEGEFLAIVYAGLSAFSEAVEMARKIKADNPTAKIVITTCDCDIRHKTHTLTPMLERKEIEAVVVTGMCGGRGMMHDILEGIVRAWPAN